MKAPRVFSDAGLKLLTKSTDFLLIETRNISALEIGETSPSSGCPPPAGLRGSHWRQPDSRGTRPTMMPEERAQSD
ncbi:hypothetical protein ACOJBO_29155 [Rhizobium beringeri]|jgi:hypothetical protein